jgi:hypothetical protein
MNVRNLKYAVPAVLLLGLAAACGSSPPPPPVTLHGVFIDLSGANITADGQTCASYENGSYQLSAEAGGKTQIADLTFTNTLAGYEPAGKIGQGQAWLCVGKWSVTVPGSTAGWIFTLTPSNYSPSSVTVPSSSSGSSIALDDGGGNNGGDLELSNLTELALTAKPQPGAIASAAAAARAATAQKAAAEKKAAAAQKAAAAARAAAARKAAAEKKAAAERAHAIHEARIAAENTLISATKWDEVIRNPDAYIGDIFTISGTVAEYNLDSNSLATVENAAIVAVDANGNYFVVECDASKLGNVQPGQTFTAKVTVLGTEEAENTVYGGTSEVPDFDASTFTVTG